MKTLVIIKTGQTYPDINAEHGDFEHWFMAGLEHPDLTLSVHNPTAGEALPSDADGIVITGSPAMVSDREPWSELTAEWLRTMMDRDIPLLGVCYGHQLLAHACGGSVGYRSQGREMGTLMVELEEPAADDVLFADLPAGFLAHLTHRQSVLGLPPNAIRLARSEAEPNQAFRIGRHAWGVQFHPEFSAPIMQAYIARLKPDLLREGIDPASLSESIKETPQASALLARFARLVAQR